MFNIKYFIIIKLILFCINVNSQDLEERFKSEKSKANQIEVANKK